MCESEAEVFATGTSECYGWAWQTYGVRCKDNKGQHCDMEVSTIADYSMSHNFTDEVAINLWNLAVSELLKK